MAKCAKKNEQKIRERAANRSSGRSESDWWEKIQMMEGKERSSASPSNQQPAFCFSWAAAHLSYKYPILSFSLYIYILYYRLHSRCWKYYSITPAGTSFTRDSLSRSPPPQFFFYSSLSALPFRLLFGWWLGIGSRCVFYVRHTRVIYIKRCPKERRWASGREGKKK
jgi:hypothetical protein